MIEAHIIADSISPQGNRLTTFKLRYPKFIHGEFMTHRAFSRNASSSRAIPVAKNIEEVRSDARAAPVYWGAEQKGMQSGEELGRDMKDVAQIYWNDAAMAAAEWAETLHKHGAHKSIVNRVLEPYLHINVVATSSEPGLMNFFGLRLDKAAQPEIPVLAETMWAAWNESKPRLLQPGKWHMPFIEKWDEPLDVDDAIGENLSPIAGNIPLLVPVSVARCARVSYESFETARGSTVEEDLKLYERLLTSGHWSPFEHQATPDELDTTFDDKGFCPDCGTTPLWENIEQHGNLVGWRQLRKMMPGEAIAPLPVGYSK